MKELIGRPFLCRGAMGRQNSTVCGNMRWWGALLAVLLLFILPLNAQSDRPPILPLRFMENYSFLKDTDQRQRRLDSIKYIPLGEKSSYLTLGADFRFLYERIANPFGDIRPYYLLRLMAHADLHLGKRWRIFVQPASGLELGSVTPRPIDVDELFLLNAFVDYQLHPTAEDKWTLRLGRFELNYNPGRMVTLREGPNVRHFWEGAMLMYRWGEWQLDAFATKYGANRPGVFDNTPFAGPETFWGTYLTRTAGKQRTLQAYYLGQIDEAPTFYNATGKERRHTVGIRAAITFPSGIDIDVETAGQLGTIGPQLINAWGASADIGYTFIAHKRYSARLGVKLDYWTGDRDSTDQRLQSFKPPYPRQGYYRGAGAVFSSNFRDVHPELLLTFGRRTSLLLDVTWYWRNRTEDGIYIGGAGRPLLPPTGSSSTYLGRQIDVTASYQINRNTYLRALYSYYTSGGFVAENPSPQEVATVLDLTVGIRL